MIIRLVLAESAIKWFDCRSTVSLLSVCLRVKFNLQSLDILNVRIKIWTFVQVWKLFKSIVTVFCNLADSLRTLRFHQLYYSPQCPHKRYHFVHGVWSNIRELIVDLPFGLPELNHVLVGEDRVRTRDKRGLTDDLVALPVAAEGLYFPDRQVS